MIAVVTGDIVSSRKLKDQSVWITPLKQLLAQFGTSPTTWEIYRGDSFQLEIASPEDALLAVFKIKSLIKTIRQQNGVKLKSPIDVRLTIGIGEKSYEAEHVSESNGSAFIRSGERLEQLKKERSTLAIDSGQRDLDRTLNLLLSFASMAMDSWSIASGELMQAVLLHPKFNQSEIGNVLGIEQNSVSDRYRRAHVQEFLELEDYFRSSVKEHFPA